MARTGSAAGKGRETKHRKIAEKLGEKFSKTHVKDWPNPRAYKAWLIFRKSVNFEQDKLDGMLTHEELEGLTSEGLEEQVHAIIQRLNRDVPNNWMVEHQVDGIIGGTIAIRLREHPEWRRRRPGGQGWEKSVGGRWVRAREAQMNRERARQRKGDEKAGKEKGTTWKRTKTEADLRGE